MVHVGWSLLMTNMCSYVTFKCCSFEWHSLIGFILDQALRLGVGHEILISYDFVILGEPYIGLK